MALVIGLLAGAAGEKTLLSPKEVQASGTVSAFGYSPTAVFFLQLTKSCISSPVQECITRANVTAEQSAVYAYSVQLQNGFSYQVEVNEKHLPYEQLYACEAGIVFIEGVSPVSYNVTCIQGTEMSAP